MLCKKCVEELGQEERVARPGIRAWIFKIGKRLLGCTSHVSLVLLMGLAGCTSLGHEGRAQPQIERSLATQPNAVAVVGSGELSIALELMLVSKGLRVHASPLRFDADDGDNRGAAALNSRYVINVNSDDLDMCVPEGSRQMHFDISVVDLVSDERLFVMSGDYGCKDTLVRRFERWFFGNY